MIIEGGTLANGSRLRTDVCVVGAPDSEWGERVVAHVVPTDPDAPPGLAELRAFVADRLSAAKLPREVVITAAIPRTAGGKPLRRMLVGPSASPDTIEAT